MKNNAELTGLIAYVFLSHTVFAGTTHYVDISSKNPVVPYTSWSTAAMNIQDAVDAAVSGDLVLVTNGIYNTGGRVVSGLLTNRVSVTNAITLRSVNGPNETIIEGHQLPGGTNGNSAVRCVYLSSNAVLVGFTLTNGATRNYDWPVNPIEDFEGWNFKGGGVYCESVTALVSNCLIVGCSAGLSGGGTRSGFILNSSIIGNRVATYGAGGGADSSMLRHCLLLQNTAIGGSGGGAWAYPNFILENCQVVSNTANYAGGVMSGRLNNCLVAGNRATSAGGLSSPDGGGVAGCKMNNSILVWNTAERNAGGAASGSFANNCLIISNSAGQFSGGVEYTRLNNCTVVGNVAGVTGGGVVGGSATNSIIYFNHSPDGPNYAGTDHTFNCTFPQPPGAGSITNYPNFEDIASGNFRLGKDSACIDAGIDFGTDFSGDLDGRLRLIGSATDLGAYEFQGTNLSKFIGWLQQNRLPTDGSADLEDSDGDKMSNWQEWIAGVSPTDATSVLVVDKPIASAGGVRIAWQSVSNRTYYLQRSMNLNPSDQFISIESNIVGQVGTTSIIDTTATNGIRFYYRVGVQ